jgi:hypothetical protein
MKKKAYLKKILEVVDCLANPCDHDFNFDSALKAQGQRVDKIIADVALLNRTAVEHTNLLVRLCDSMIEIKKLKGWPDGVQVGHMFDALMIDIGDLSAKLTKIEAQNNELRAMIARINQPREDNDSDD